VARAREVPGFDCEEPFAAAAARVVAVRSAEVFEHSGGVLDVEEIKHLHDMRVATRRLRAAMEVFAACFPRKRFRKRLKEVKALSDALGARRDRDVGIEFLTGFAAEAPEADRAALGEMIDAARREQRLANQALAPRLEEESLDRLRHRLEKLVARARA
jgi:CHAD domain-containing protein